MNPVLTNFKNYDNILSFDITSTHVSFVNAIRRVILSDITTPSFKTFPYDESDCIIHSNTSKFNNEIIKQRLACVPIHIDDDSINIENLILKLKVQNDTASILYVTTQDFKLFDESTNNFLSKELTEQIFPKNNITNDYILFLKLQPPFIQNSQIKTNGEEIDLQCRISRNSARINSMFNVVSMASFTNILVPEQSLKQYFEQYKQDMLKKDTFNDDELILLENDWYALNSKKYFIPFSFHFIIKTIGVYQNNVILKKAINIILDKFNNFLQQKDISLFEIIKNDTFAENCFNILLKNEDYTLGKILEYIIFSEYIENLQLSSFVSFKKTHPHDKDSIIIIVYNDPIDIPDVLQHFNLSIVKIIDILNNILKQIPA